MAEEDIAKVVLVGAANVGKTSIITRAFKHTFSEDVKPTIGTGFAKGTFKGSSRSVTLEVWDTAGQELYHSLTPLFFNGASVTILVYDITSRSSFEQLDQYLSMVKDKVPTGCIIALTGNKIDLAEKDDSAHRAVTFVEGNEYATAHGLSFFCETSALTGYGVDLLFSGIVDDPNLAFMSQMMELPVPNERKKEKGCC